MAGGWEGRVLTGSRSLAAKCTAIMHQRRPEDLSEAEVRDGWGEPAKVVGGDLEAPVRPVSRLSLPEVRENAGFACAEPGRRPVNQMTFGCLGRIRLPVPVPGS